MTRTIFYTATTINGFLADEQGSLDWLTGGQPPPEAAGEAGESGPGEPPPYVTFAEQVGALVEGSTTYQWCVDHGETDYTGGRFPTFVFTSRSLPAAPGADVRFRSGDVREVYDEIHAAAGGKDIWLVGGGDLAGQFYDAGLLNELQLSIAPVALPGGAALLPRRIESSSLSLQDVRRFGQFAHLTYHVVR